MKKIFLSIALLTVAFVSAENNTSTINSNVYSSSYTSMVNSFCKLIQMGDYETVKSLVAEGVDINKKSAGLTPLMYAARHNKPMIAKLLIENGAKLKVKSDRRGFTPLKWAELSNAKEVYVVIENALTEQKVNKKKRRFS